MQKRITAIILVLVMVFTCLPFPAMAAQEQRATVSNGETSLGASNTLGSLLSEEVSEETDNNYESGYALYELEVDGMTATVTFDTAEDANLLVCIYDEHTMQLLTSANTQVSAAQTGASVEFPQELPEAFYAEVFLLDRYDYSPLCYSLECPLYTTEMQELLASTVADYDPEKVLNLDDSTRTNFLVCGEDTQLVEQVAGVNTVTFADDEAMVYVIENADETFTELKPGDTVVYPYGEEDMLIAKVDQITVDGSKVTIVGAELELEDVFSHIKISESGDMSQVDVDENDLADGIEYTGLKDTGAGTFASGEGNKQKEMTFEMKLTANKGTMSETYIKGALKLKFDVDFYYYLTLGRQYIQLNNTITADYSVSFGGKVTPVDFPLCGSNGINVPLGATGLALNICPTLIFEVSGELTAHINVVVPTVATYKNGNLSFSVGKIATDLGELKVSVTVFVGIDVKPSIVLVSKKIACLELGLPLGVRLKIATDIGGVDIAYPTEKHTCNLCLTVNVDFTFSVNFSVKILNCDRLSAGLELLSKEWPIHECYISIDNNETGKGKCPHREFRVTIFTINSDEKATRKVDLACDGDPLNAEQFDGYAIAYLPADNYMFSAYFQEDDAYANEFVTISGAKTVTLTTSKAYLERLEAYKKMTVGLLEDALEYNCIDSGTVGDMEWAFFKSGKLTISGTGGVPHYNYASETPWYPYRDQITMLEIKDGITWVGQFAFSNLKKLKSLVIADSVQTLNRGSFENCSALYEVRLPVDLNFSGWTGTHSSGSYYSSFTGTNNVERIHYTYGRTGQMRERNTTYSHSYSSAQDYYYPRSLEYISKDSLRTVYFDDGITSVAPYAFYETTALEDIYIPASVTSIGAYTFYNSSIDEIYLPVMLTNLGNYAFYSCENLTAIDLPKTLTQISAYCFSYCSGLTEIEIPNGVTVAYRDSFSYCTGLKSVTMPADMKFSSWTGTYSSGSYYSAFTGTTNVEEIHYTYGQTGQMRERGPTYSHSYSTAEDYYYGRTLENISGQNLKKVTLDDGITNIAPYGFYATNLEEIEIPDTVETIGYKAFSGCTKLYGIEIPAKVTSIGGYAFNGCSSLKSITLPLGLTQISEYCFSGCSGLMSIVIPNGVTVAQRDSFAHCTGLKSVTMPVDMKFSSWTGTYSSGSYYSAFTGTLNVESIRYTYGQTGKMRERNTTYSHSYSTAEDYYYARTLEYISKDSLKRLYFEDGITSIAGYAAFDSALTSVRIPDSVTSIGYYAFNSCDDLTKIDLPLGLTFMGEYALAGTGLTAIEIPETMTALSRGCFSGCAGLTEIVIPDSIAQVGQNTFANCTGLKSVTMPIDLNFSGWEGYYNSGSYYSAYKGTTNVETIHYTPGRTGAMLARSTSSSYSNSGQSDAYYVRTLEYISKDSLKTVTFAEGVTSIARLAFTDSALEKATFFGDKPTIAYDAFNMVTAEMYYPLDNATWEGDMPVCGGTLTWIGYVLDEDGEVEVPEEEIPEPTEEMPEEPAMVEEVFEIEDVPTVEGVFQGQHSAWYDEIIAHHTASFDGLVPCEQYLLLVLAEADAEDLIEPSNLLYAAQDVADENGSLTFTYIQREDTEYAYVIACGATNQNLRDANVNFPIVYSSTMPQIMDPLVVYDGKILEREIDYTLTGDYVYTDAGTYTCGIRGINNYAGSAEFTYEVLPYVYVSEITLNMTEALLFPGDSIRLTAETEPSNANNPTVIWTSSDESVAAVDALGNVTAIADGTATITAAAEEGDASAECVITVSSALAFRTQPEDYTGLVGDVATFMVETNWADATFQWYYSSDDGETWKKHSCTSNVLDVEFKAYRLNYLYRCEATFDGVTIVSEAARLMGAKIPLQIIRQPQDQLGIVGDELPMTVRALGNGLTYEWFFSTDGGETWAKSYTPGYAADTLKPILRAYRDGYLYRCVVSDVFGNSLTTEAASIHVYATDVTIVTQPASVENGIVDQLYQFHVEANGENLSYRWYFSTDGGETWAESWNQGYNTDTLSVRMYAYRSGYLYRCIVTSGVSESVISEAACLNLQAPSVEILGVSGSVYVLAGESISFHVDAVGNDLSYLWYRSNDNGETWTQTWLTGYNTDTLNFVANASRAALYRCKVTDGSGKTLWSSNMRLRTLSAKLEILAQPESVVCASGETAAFTVTAQGDSLKYQWYASADGVSWTMTYLTGYNTDTLSFAVNASRAAKIYRCVVTDAAGNTVTSDIVSVTITP